MAAGRIRPARGGRRRRRLDPSRGRTRPDLHRIGCARGPAVPTAPESPRAKADLQQLPELELRIGQIIVASYDPGSDTAATSSPRPYLHPVRTLGGFTVTDAHPADHDWHVGIGVALQDVNGWNLWGGRTYVRDAGYQWLGDHGSDRARPLEPTDTGTCGRGTYVGRRPGSAICCASAASSAGDRQPRVGQQGGRAWVLELSFALSIPAAADFDTVRLGSPGSNGREAGGYGGFFWRLPRTDEADTPHARHGRRGGRARHRRRLARGVTAHR